MINIRDALDFLERAKKALIDDDMTYEDYDECISLLIAEVERLRSVISEPVKSFGTMELVSWVNQLQKTISEYPDAEWGNWPFVLMMGVHCENFSKHWHSPTIELMAARIKELEAEVEAKQANNEYLQKMTEEAQGIMQESQLLLCKEANEAEQLQKEVERLRSENKIISDRAAHHEKQDAAEIELLAARIKELEALNELNHKNMRSWLDTTTDKEFLDKLSSEIGFKDAYIKRLEAAFLDHLAARLYYEHYPGVSDAYSWHDYPEDACQMRPKEMFRQKAREALEQLRAEGKIGGGDGE